MGIILLRRQSKLAQLSLVFLVLVGIALSTGTSWARQNGQVTGRITDVDTKEYLPGANVMLKGTGFGAATDRTGAYRIVNVPPGPYELVVRYIGFVEQSVNVTVGEKGLTVTQDVALKSGVVQLSGVQIVGLRQGQNKALNVQKSADKIMNVVAAEQIVSFPDINSAEVLQRIPGISIQRDQGEGRYVQVRGTESRLNTMKVNGEQIPSPEAKTRNSMMDIIPADQLATIEVSKVITPDMDGNSVGGTVNLITKSALDYEKATFSATAGSGYANLSGKGYPGSSLPGNYQAGVSYGTRLGEAENIGIMVSGSFLRTDRGSDNSQPLWGPITLTDVAKTVVPWGLQELIVRDYSLRRDRMGASGTLDYKPSEGHKLSLKVIYDDFEDSEIRHQLRARMSKGKYTSATVITGATYERLLRDRSQEQTMYNVIGRGEHDLGSIVLDYTLSYSYGKEKQNWYYSPTFVGNAKVNYTLDLSDTDIPKYTVTSPSAGYELDPKNFTFSALRFQDYITGNKAYAATVNLKIPYRLGGNPSDFKFGGKMDLRKKDRNGLDVNYTLKSGSTPILLTQFLGDFKVENFLAGNYDFGALPDPAKVQDWFKANKDGLLVGAVNRDNTDASNFTVEENIYAFYAMTTINFGELMFLVGARDEITQDKVKANAVQYDKSGNYLSTTPVASDKTNNNILPMVHLRYRLDAETNIRGAFTSNLGRANYYDLVPYRIANDQSSTITMGNADLKLTTSYGFDLLAEHFFQRIGILSGGFFYKNLSDIIYTQLYTQVGGTYNGWQVTQPVNGGNATLYGVELDWQQQLTFLPGFMDGFGIYANYTYTKSKADLAGHAGSKLPGQAGNVANFALSYQKYGFTAKVSLNYADKFIDLVGIDSDNDTYYDSHTQLDANANMQLFSGFSVYVQFMNLTNAPLRYYIGDHSRPTQREFYSWWMQAGVKFNLE